MKLLEFFKDYFFGIHPYTFGFWFIIINKLGFWVYLIQNEGWKASKKSDKLNSKSWQYKNIAFGEKSYRMIFSNGIIWIHQMTIVL